MPETNGAAQDLIAIVNQLCNIDVAEAFQPSRDLEAAVLRGAPVVTKDSVQKLLNYLLEAIDKFTEAQIAMQDWKLMFSRSTLETFSQLVTEALQIPRKEYIGLNAEESSRLYILVQITIFAYFMKNKENVAAYGDLRTHIKDLQLKIMRVGNTLRQLLPLTNGDIQNYLTQVNIEHVASMERVSTVSSIRRAICCTAVELILNTLKKIGVSVDTNSITLA